MLISRRYLIKRIKIEGLIMIKFTNDKKTELLDFLMKKPSENCFIIGDLENFDLEVEFMDLWILENQEKITSVLLRYYKSYIVYSENKDDIEKISLQIKKDKNCLNISGLEETIDQLSNFIQLKTKINYLAEITEESIIEFEGNVKPVRAEEDDIEDLFEFQSSIAEFNYTDEHKDSFGQEIVNGSGRIYYIKDGGKIVSSATLTAENSMNGTIIGVATDKEYRRKGYAKACVYKMCRELIDDKKRAVLFYSNMNAGKLYKEIGFRDINKWVMADLT